MWLFALCLGSLSLAGHEYYDSKLGWEAPGKVAAVVDVNKDGLDDIIFLESKTIYVYCATLPSGYKPCSSREFKNEDQFIGIIPADFNQNSDLGFIILTQSEEAAEEFGLLHLDRLNGTVVWRSSRTTSVVPVVADVDFDGYLDLFGLSEGERFVWINKGQSNGFQDRKWSELGDYFDLETYSSVPKFDLNINNHIVAVSPQKDEVNGVFGWLKSRWNSFQHRVNRPSGGDKNQSAETVEEVYYKRHEMDVKYEDWQPRPLPLVEPAKLARIPGSRLADINGDCVADLVLVVQSPDFESRYELEIWITENNNGSGDTVNNIKWRMWKGQRILLPEGTQAIELEDFSNSGNTDLLVFACDADWHPCQKLQRVFLMKMFQPPQCSSRHLMPKSSAQEGRSLCKNSLCSSSPFVFGGVDEGMRRTGVSISNILHNTSESVLIPNIHPAFPTIIRTVDFDRDGYLDIVLLAEKQPQSRFFRVLRNLPPRGDAEANDFTRVEFTITSLKEALTRLFNYARQIGSNSPRRFDPLKARRFEPVADIRTDSAPFYAGGFTEDWSDPGILNFIGFSGQSHLNSSVHLFKKYSSSESTFFLTALALGPVDESCSNTSVLPMLGSTFVLTTTGLDGYKYPIKRVRGTLGGVQGVIKPKSTYIGLGSSSNYIDAFVLGVPYASQAAPSCAAKSNIFINETNEPQSPETKSPEPKSPETALFHRFMEHFEDAAINLSPRGLGEQEKTNPLQAYWQKWVAILPNSQISIKLGNPRWKNKEWLLSLSVNPGKQAFGIVVVRPRSRKKVSFKGTAICLTIVGSVILYLDQKEKVGLRVGKFESLVQAVLSKEQQGFRKQFITV